MVQTTPNSILKTLKAVDFKGFTAQSQNRPLIGLTEIEDVFTLMNTSVLSSENWNTYCGTGSILHIVDDDHKYICTFTFVVKNDTNGDGVCDVLDCADVERASNGNADLIGVYAEAGDTNGDDAIDINDYQAIVNKALAS